MTLTREQIEAMPAGPELDAAVAEHVMGSRPPLARGGNVWANPDGNPNYASQIPLYSTDIAAAWEVVEKMLAVGFSFTYFDTANISSKPGVCAAFKLGVYPPKEGDADAFRGYGFREQSAPLAICRAALIAKLAGKREAER